MIIPEKLDLENGLAPGFDRVGNCTDTYSKHEQSYFIIKYSNLAVFYREEENHLRKGHYYKSQMCIPYAALEWLYLSINSFYTSPSQGGQPAGTLGVEKEVGNERLLLNRASSIDGTDYPGFTLSNLSREVYGRKPGSKARQQMSMTDEFVKNSKFLNMIKPV